MPIPRGLDWAPRIQMNAHTKNSNASRTMGAILLTVVWLAQSLVLQGRSFEPALVSPCPNRTATCCCSAEAEQSCCCQCQRKSCCCSTAAGCCSKNAIPSSGKCRCIEFPSECTCAICLCGTDDLPKIPPALPSPSSNLRLHLLLTMQWTGEVLTLVDATERRSFAAGPDSLNLSTTASQTCVKLSRFRC